ncbi:hydrolase [Streptomyces spinosirectus]|jgi:dienelactone hydrolase|uniref:alpha/beta hydrolase family protein n=1 Tax=Streptomyces TaxID=1883 RepID=UPI001C9DBB77|nr:MULTISPECIES: hydrolase [Streptomyces]MBY8339165.1 hydrolase [Streptomyces plumbidurans]UIR21941.1 hydrolase [Streptomyces spinosirectus]
MPTRRAVMKSAAAALALSAFPARAASATPASATHASAPVPASATSRKGDGLRLKLPGLSGPYPVGTVSLHLVDSSRPDPWITSQPYRELMIGIRYPARSVDGYRRAPQMLPGEAAGFAALNSFTDVPADKVDWAATLTHAHEGAPVERGCGPLPVVLYSPGAGDPRSLGTTLCDDLASRGHVVVTVDHTYDASAVEFPGGRVERSVLPAEYDKAFPDPERIRALLHKTIAVRVADTRFVLDELPHALPRALRGTTDFGRIGMFGQSGGGYTALQAMHDDPRIAAAADLDGVLADVQEDSTPGNLSTVAADGVDRPFLLIGMDGNDLSTVPSWDAVWRHSHGWHRGLNLRGAEHATYTDAVALVPQIARRLGLPRRTVVENVGTIAPRHAIKAQRAYVAAFFDRWLRDRDDHGLLDGPSSRYPEARFF